MEDEAEKTHEVISRKQFAFEVKAIEADGVFSGYGSVFGVVDSYKEVVEAGAFAKSLREHKKAGTMPALLWQHDAREPIGVFTKMKEDAVGLYVEGQLLVGQNVPNADKAYSLLKAGALSGLSIGFMTKLSMYDEEKRVRYLKEVELWETSLVTFPANTAARITGVKSDCLQGMTAENAHLHKREIEAALRDAGASVKVAQFIASQIQKPALRDDGGENLSKSLDKIINTLRG